MSLSQAKKESQASTEGYESWAEWRAAVSSEVGYRVCGEPTVKKPVRPCSRPAAWGIDNADSGPCVDHQEDAGVKRQAIKKTYLELVASGNYTLQGCAKMAGVDRKTLDRWAETDAEFATDRREAERSRARRRLENLSDSMYRDALAGKTKGNERIFLMKVYAASLRRRGIEPPLDWDQPDNLEVVHRQEREVESPLETLRKKLDAIAERTTNVQGDADSCENGDGSVRYEVDRER